MDRSEGYNTKHWASEKISIKDFYASYSPKVPKVHCLPSDPSEACFKVMGCDISQKQYKYLEEYCGTEQLCTYNSTLTDVKLLKEKPQTFNVLEVDSSSKLKTLNALKDRKAKKDLKFKYKGNVWMTYDKPELNDLEPLSEVVLAVRVFRPFAHQRGVKYRQEPSLRQQLLVLGRQYLSELRDVIKCVSDGPLMKETSDCPQQRSTIFAKDKYKSGFFFIEGTFYNDHRLPTNIDYSEVIRNWATERKMTFATKKMEETKFIDLSIQLGHPYVYQHQGSCEHLIIFSDLRILNTNDILSVEHYPLLDVMKKVKTRMCIVCGVFSANWLTKNNERVFTHTAYFCDTCFRSFNYIDGKKIGNFLAYPIYQE